MKPSILLLALTAITVTSCTSAYKAGQTPDDVYFSPQRPQTEYVNARDRDEDPGYDDGQDYYGDRYLQMKVKNRYQWQGLDDYYYNDRYSYGMGGYSGYSYYNSLYMNPWSPASYWNYYYNPYYSSYYNPYYSPVVIVGPKYYGGGNYNNSTVSNRPRVFNLNTYNNNMLNTNNYTSRNFNYNNTQNVNTSNRYNNNYRNTRSSAGDYLRNQFGNSNNNNTNYSNNNSNFNSSNSGGSRSSGASSSGGGGSSSSGGGGSAPVRRF